MAGGKSGGKPGAGGRGGKAAGGKGSGARGLTTRVKTARRRKTSSTRWLKRQLNDPYVAAAQRDGYRSRAAYKLSELDDRFGFLRPGATVVDLGAAPGGWSQVASQRVGPRGLVLAVDIAEIDPLPEISVLQGDVFLPETEAAIVAATGGPVDVVLSDMAPAATGHRATDHLRIIGLVEAALDLARAILKPGGCFIAKVWQGGTEGELLAEIKRDFTTVRHAKPKASRADSAEIYLVAQGYRPAGHD